MSEEKTTEEKKPCEPNIPVNWNEGEAPRIAEVLGNRILDHLEQKATGYRRITYFRIGLVAVIVIAIFSISYGLIFHLDRVNDGLMILTHIVALLAGLLAGTALQDEQ